MSISVVILAKNEEENLPKALDSVKWADEFIVGVDTTSTDETEAIAKERGCKVYHSDLSEGFATVKNKLIAKATKDWFLVLDADERVTPELEAEIKRAMASDDYKAYWIPFHNNLLGSFMDHGGWLPDLKLRLVANGFGKYGAQEIHEQMEIEGEVGTLTSMMNHYSHRTVKELLRRIDQYSDLDAPIVNKRMPEQLRKRNLVMPMVREFYRRYVTLRGYKDGMAGLIEAVMQAFYIFAGHAKAWELRNNHERL
jgi:glycosyltransferase involved in cell wall biosynthesis